MPIGIVILRPRTPEVHLIHYSWIYDFSLGHPSLNIKQGNGKIVTEVTKYVEIWEVTFILVCSCKEIFCVNNLKLNKNITICPSGISERKKKGNYCLSYHS